MVIESVCEALPQLLCADMLTVIVPAAVKVPVMVLPLTTNPAGKVEVEMEYVTASELEAVSVYEKTEPTVAETLSELVMTGAEQTGFEEITYTLRATSAAARPCKSVTSCPTCKHVYPQTTESQAAPDGGGLSGGGGERRSPGGQDDPGARPALRPGPRGQGQEPDLHIG